MKKFLLLAAFFAAMTMSAQEFTLTEVASTENVPIDRANNRQGFGMEGKFIVMDKVLGEINVYAAEDGTVENTFYTGATASWPAVTRDEAGNIIARVDNSWPGNFMADTVIMKIFPAGGGDPIDVEGNIFADFVAENGRCDFFSFIEGNVMEEGILWLVTAKSTGILKVPFVEGEIDEDHIALFPVDGATLSPTSSTVVNPYVAADGTKHYMLWTRNAAAVDMVMNDTEDGFIGTAFTLPNKGATNGCFPLTFGGKDLVIYTTMPNYGNAWAIAEKNAEEAIAVVPEGAYSTNGFQCNWLNAEVIDENTAIIYQYFPGNYFKTYELTIGGAEEHTYAVCGAPAALFGMENDWDPAAAPEMQMNDNGLYEWTSEATELQGGEIQFKVVQDHAWDVCYPENNYRIAVPGAGEYILNVTYNPENNEVNATLTAAPIVIEDGLFVVGSFNDWNTNEGGGRIAFTEVEEGGIFEAKVDLPAEAEFKIIYPTDKGIIWFGGEDANNVGYFLINNDMLSTPISLVDGANFKMQDAAVYIIRVRTNNVNGLQSVSTPLLAEFVYYAPTAITNINTDKADNTWYNLQGQKLNGKPATAGIYINGGKKVIVK